MSFQVFALDLGDTTGWARLNFGNVTHGTLDLGLERGEHPGLRWPRVRDLLRDFFVVGSTMRGSRIAEPAWVVWEQIIPAQSPGTIARSNLYGLEAQLVEVAAEFGLEPKTVHLSTLKKFATGSGKAKKDDMRAAAASRWPGVEFTTHDEVDARWILEWAIAELGEARA